MAHRKNRSQCFICGNAGEVRYPENISQSAFNDFTFASRKPPELMHYELSYCGACEILYSTHLPGPGELFEAYESAGYDSELEARFAARTYFKSLKEVLINPEMRILDVGCGDGQFMKECVLNGFFDVFGIEPSRDPHTSASPEVKDSIFLGPWEKFAGTESFNLITLFQTVEHLHDVDAFLDFAHRNLSPGGKLAIASHNFNSVTNRILGVKSPIFDVEHLQLFSPKSIKLAVQKHGFEVDSCRAYLNVYPLSYLLRLAPVPKFLKSSAISGSYLGRASVPAPFGNIMTIATRPE